MQAAGLRCLEDLTSRVQALEFTNEEERLVHQQQILKLSVDHQQAIEGKDVAFALLNDDLQNLNMKMWLCKHRGMYMRTSYKKVKTLLAILGRIMFLMQKIQAKTTLL